MSQLIANPSKYHRKLVRVVGYFVYQDNRFGSSLYVSKELGDCLSNHHSPFSEDGLAVILDANNLAMEPYSSTPKFNKKHVVIEGMFKKRALDPVSDWPFENSIRAHKIQSIEPIDSSAPSEPSSTGERRINADKPVATQ